MRINIVYGFRILATLVTITCAMDTPLIAQQDAMYTHYMYNTQTVNPAYAGSRDALTVTGIHRSQWAGFEGAPVTQTLSMHTPLLNPKLGFGFSVVNDRVGPASFAAYFGDFTYKINFESDRTLAFGIKAGLSTFSANFTSLASVTAGDNALQNNIQSEILPNLGTGVYYYTKRFYAGFSVPKIMQNSYTPITSNGFTGIRGEQRHYYMISGALVQLGKSVTMKPFGFVKMTSGAPVEMDLTTLFIFYDRLTFGMMVRMSDAYGVLVGVNINEQLELGYSFDWSYKLANYYNKSGSHEIMLRYDFVYSSKKNVRSPRNFYF